MNISKQATSESPEVNMATVIAKVKAASEQRTVDQVLYQFVVKLEANQKCVKPTVSVHGIDGDACVREARLLNQVRTELGQNGCRAAPINHEVNAS